MATLTLVDEILWPWAHTSTRLEYGQTFLACAMLNQMSKVKIFLLGLGVFLLATGGSYLVFKKTNTSLPASSVTPTTTASKNTKRPTIDPSIPRTEVCPLNGAMFTKQEKDIWDTRRPLGVMIENTVDARPQSGLSTADIVYEAVAEGGITRFMGLFYCNAAMAGNITLAPVRSARIYFVNLISEYDGLYNHVGGAGNCDDPNVDPRAKALCTIRKNNIKDLDQFGRAGDFKTCHRLANRLDREVAYEHTMACFLEELYNAGAKAGWTNVDEKGVAWNKGFVSWKFKTESTKISTSPATNISYMFWEHNRDFNKSFDTSWKYDSVTNSYLRSNAGTQSIDLNTNEPLAFKNLVIEYTKETNLGDLEHHMLYDVMGTGKAQFFMDGQVIEGTWSKASRTARTLYFDKSGKEIKFNPGPIWISIIPSTNTVTIQ